VESQQRREQMRKLILAFVTLLLASGIEAAAHPATGIVVDRAGNVYFSDLETVWKVDLQGKLSVFRKGEHGRHVHELSIDEKNNIYGADVSYEPATKKWISDVWKMTPEGKLSYLLEPTTDPPRGMSMWLDREGNMYLVDQNNHLKKQTLVLRRTPDGTVTTLAGSAYGLADGKGHEARFGSIGGMVFGPDECIYLTDGTSVRKVAKDGTVTTVASGLDFKRPEDDPRLFASYGGLAGLSVDPDRNVYVADAGKRRLLKINPQGQASVVWRNEPPYFPNGVAAVGQNIYVLELGLTLPNLWSGPRIRKIGPDGKSTILATVGGEANGGLGTSVATAAGVAAERTLVAFTGDGRLKYNIALVGLGVLSIITIIWLRRRRQRA
jgi:sugar lactone lactonase YvrE